MCILQTAEKTADCIDSGVLPGLMKISDGRLVDSAAVDGAVKCGFVTSITQKLCDL